MGGSRSQASKLAKNRVRLYLTLDSACKVFHQMTTANQEQSSQEEGRGLPAKWREPFALGSK